MDLKYGLFRITNLPLSFFSSSSSWWTPSCRTGCCSPRSAVAGCCGETRASASQIWSSSCVVLFWSARREGREEDKQDQGEGDAGSALLATLQFCPVVTLQHYFSDEVWFDIRDEKSMEIIATFRVDDDCDFSGTGSSGRSLFCSAPVCSDGERSHIFYSLRFRFERARPRDSRVRLRRRSSVAGQGDSQYDFDCAALAGLSHCGFIWYTWVPCSDNLVLLSTQQFVELRHRGFSLTRHHR